MKPRYRLYRRGASGRYYAQDGTTNKQESLGTSDKAEAVRLLNAKIESAYHPAFNRIWEEFMSKHDVKKNPWFVLGFGIGLMERLGLEGAKVMPY